MELVAILASVPAEAVAGSSHVVALTTTPALIGSIELVGRNKHGIGKSIVILTSIEIKSSDLRSATTGAGVVLKD